MLTLNNKLKIDLKISENYKNCIIASRFLYKINMECSLFVNKYSNAIGFNGLFFCPVIKNAECVKILKMNLYFH